MLSNKPREAASFASNLIKGLCKDKKLQKSKITMEVGGWVQVTRNFFCGKSSQNSLNPVVIFWNSIPCVFCPHICIAKSYWLLWFECSVHVSDGFPTKKSLDGGWVGVVDYIQFFFGIFGICLTLQSPFKNSKGCLLTMSLDRRAGTRGLWSEPVHGRHKRYYDFMHFASNLIK